MNAEAKLISAVCKNKDINVLLAENVDDFFTSHKDIWESVKKYYWQYRAIPDIAELEQKHRDFDAENVAGPTKFYLDELRNDYISNRLRNLMVSKTSELKEKAGAEVLQELFGELSGLNKLTDTVRDIDIMDYDAAEQHYKAQAERSAAMGGSPGIPTGFKSVDISYPTGMAPGHLIVVIGWPGKGKTWFTAYLACKAWEQGFRPMIVSLEMSPENMRDRIYTMMGSGLFRASDFSRGDVDIDNFRAWGRKKFENKNNFIIVSSEGNASVTPSTIQAKIDQHRPDLVIADYHQLFDDDRHSRSEVERNRNISRELKLLAVNNNIPVVDITAATADDISDRDSAPILAQVAWSKAIEYDADMAMAVHKQGDSNIIEVVSRKNRHGEDFAMFLDWDIDRGIITEIYAND